MTQSLKGKRVLFLLSTLEVGGAERQALNFALHLRENEGAEVAFCGFGPPGRFAVLCKEARIPCESIRPPHRARAYVRVGLALRRMRPDIVLGYTIVANLAGALTWRMTGAKLFVWNQRDEGVERGTRVKEAIATKLTSLFVSNSTIGYRFLVDRLRIRESKCHTIFNGVVLASPAQSREAWRSKLNLAPNDFAVGMVANLNAYKDHATLLHAWMRVQSNSANIRSKLLLAGRFDDRYESVKRLVHELRLEDRVSLLGPVDDVTGFLSACDAAVLSSHHEGLPNGVLEPMAAGLPVVATDLPGVWDALGTDAGDLVVPHGDAERLGNQLIRLRDDPRLRAEIGAQNRQRVSQIFAPNIVFERYSELLKSTLESVTV